MTRILVTGDQGQVGRELQVLADGHPAFDFLFPGGQAGLDITKKEEVASIFQQFAPHYCINCAAYTAVDRAEEAHDVARAINTHGSQLIAEACAAQGTHLIHFSTDYVYDGMHNTPFIETSPTAPQGVYAQTKLDGEHAAMEANPLTTIIRTSWVYSSFGHNFVKTMLRLGQEREQLNIVFDQIGTPTYARDLAEAVLHLITQTESGVVDQEETLGIFNYSNEGVTSWYDFAVAIFELAAIDCAVHPIESKDYPTPARRPHFSVLNKGKIKTTLALPIPHWRTSLKSCLRALDVLPHPTV
jgi:dTDP-4-dehydrorhamnose reductase